MDKEYWADLVFDFLILTVISSPMNLLSKVNNKLIKAVMFFPFGLVMTFMFILFTPILLFLLFATLINDFINDEDF